MANEETNRISVEIEGIEKSLNLLFKLQDSMAATAVSAAQFVTSLNTVNNILTALSSASLKNVTAEIGQLGRAFNKFGQQFDTKGVKTLIETNSVTNLAKKLQTLAISVRGLPGSSEALTVIANGLKQLSGVINDKNFSVAGPSLRKVATALVFLSEKTKGLVVTKSTVDGLLSLVGVFKAFKDIRGETNIGPALQSIAVGIGALNKEFNKATFILDPANAKSIEGLGKALQQFGKAFTGFSKNFSGEEIAKNMHLVITLISELKAQFTSFEGIDNFSNSIVNMASGLSDLSKAFRSLTIGKNIAALEGNSQILIKFINDLATIDAAPIIAKLQPLSEVIKNLADAGRAIGALKGIDNVKAKITQFGIELEKSQKRVTIWERITKAAVSGIASGVSAEFKKASQAVTAYLISLATAPIKKFFSALGSITIALVKLPFKVVGFAAKTFLSILQALFKVVSTLLAPITSITNILGRFTSQTKTAVKTTEDLSDSFQTLDKDVRRVEPVFDSFGNEVVKLAPSAKILGINLGTVGKAINSISSKAISTLSSSLKTATKNSSDFFIGFLGVDRVLQIVTRSLQQVTRLFGALGRSIFSALSETENLKASLSAFQAIELVDLGKFDTIPEALDQANKQADDLFKKFQKIAKESPFETAALVDTFNTLQTFKFDTKAAETLTRILVDFGATVGISNSQLSEFALIFGQIRASGKLLGQDMKQLQTRGLNVGEALSKAWEKWHGEIITNNEAIEKAQEGLISVDDVIVALAESMNTSFGGNAQRMNNTLTALQSTIEDIRKTLLVDLFGKAVESAKPFLNILLEIIQGEKAAAVIERLSDSIEKGLVSALTALSKAVKVGILLWQAIPAPFQEAIKQVALFATALAGVTIAVGALSLAATAVGFALSLLINPIALVAGAIAGLVIVIKRNIDIVTRVFNDMRTKAVAAFNEVYTQLTTFVSQMISKISEFTSKFASNFAATLGSMVTFGYNVIQQFANGILAALGLVVAAIQKLGQILTYWLAPGSPPRILPDIDKWGTAAANEFLGGFAVADFSLINDFGNVLRNLLKSVDLDEVDTTGIVKSFSTSLNQLNTTGEVDLTDAFEEVTKSVPTASEEVKNLLQLYLQLSQQTNELNRATTQYSDAINALEGELAGLEDSSIAQGEEKQIARLENVAKSQFISEAQRQKALQDINKIRLQQELRNLKKEEAGKQNAVDTTKEQIELLKERIDLANQFTLDDKETGIVSDSTSIDKLKDKLEKDGDSIADSIGGNIADIELALSNMSLDLPELNVDGIMAKFDTLSEDVQGAFERIRTAIDNFITNVRSTLTTLTNWKDEVVRLFQLAVAAAQEAEGVNVKSAVLGIDISSLDTTASSLGTIAGTISNILEQIYNNLVTQFTKISNIASTVRTEGGQSDVLGSILGFDATNSDQSIGLIIGNIQLAFDNAVAAIRSKVTTFVTLLESDPTLTIQDALSKALFNVDFSTAIQQAKDNIGNAIDEIVNYIPGRIALVDTLIQVGASPVEAILFSFFKVSPQTTDKILESLDTAIASVKTAITDFIKNLFPESGTGEESFLDTYLALFDTGELGEAIATFIDALGNFAKGIAPVVAAIAGAIVGLLAAIAPEIPGILAGILNSISAILNFFGDTLNTLFDIITGKVGLFEGVKTIFSSFITNILAFFGGIDQIARHIIDIIGNVATLIGGLTGIDVSGFFTIFDKVRPILEFIVSNLVLGGIGKIVGGLGKLFGLGSGSGGGFVSFLTSLTEKLRGMLGPIAEGIIGVVNRVVRFFGSIGENLSPMVDDLAFFINRPIDAFRLLGDDVAAILSNPKFGGIVTFFENMIANARQFADDIAAWFRTIPTAITEIFNSFKITGTDNAFQKSLFDFLASLIESGIKFIDDIVALFKSIPTKIKEVFSTFKIGGTADEAIQVTFDETFITQALGDLSAAFDEVFLLITGTTGNVKTFIDEIVNLGTTILQYFSTDTISKISKLILETMAIAKTEVGQVAIGFFDEVRESLNNLLTFFTEFKLPNIFESFEIPGPVKKVLELAGVDVGETIATSASTELSNIDITAPTIDTTEWAATGTTGGANIATGVEQGFNEEAKKSGFFAGAKEAITSTWANIWDSNSPSQVAADVMGLPIAQGVAEGITEGLLAEDFQAIFETMYAAITATTLTFTTLYRTNFAQFALAYNLSVSVFANDIVIKFRDMSDALLEILDILFKLVIKITNEFKVAFIEIATQTIIGFLAQFEGLGEKVIALVTAALEMVKNAYNDENEPAYVAGKTIGDALGSGIIRGIDNKIEGVVKSIRRMIDAAISAAKTALDANSPSKVTAKQIGEPFGQGIGVGIEKSFIDVDKMVSTKLARLGAMNTTIPQINKIGQDTFNTNVPSVFNQSGQMKDANLQRSIQTANNTSIVNNFSKEYHIHMTVSPERAVQVRKNFNVAEFIGVS